MRRLLRREEAESFLKEWVWFFLSTVASSDTKKKKKGWNQGVVFFFFSRLSKAIQLWEVKVKINQEKGATRVSQWELLEAQILKSPLAFNIGVNCQNKVVCLEMGQLLVLIFNFQPLY